jgi:hypothetical protein
MQEMGREMWVDGRDCFMFQCDTSNGIRWTFLVGRVELEDIEPGAADGLAAIFERNRGRIHAAAYMRMNAGNPGLRQVITSAEILDAGGPLA